MEIESFRFGTKCETSHRDLGFVAMGIQEFGEEQ